MLKRILIIDDSSTIRKVVTRTLEKQQYQVTGAENGVQGLAQVADDPPDLILLDVNMPLMDGYQVCRAIRSNQTTKHIPVVMLSGKNGAADRSKGSLAGSNDYIAKPFQAEALVNTVDKYLAL